MFLDEHIANRSCSTTIPANSGFRQEKNNESESR